MDLTRIIWVLVILQLVDEVKDKVELVDRVKIGTIWLVPQIDCSTF